MMRAVTNSLLAAAFLLAAVFCAGGPARAEDGERIIVDHVRFHGNDGLSRKKLLSVMMSRPSNLFKENRYSRDVLDEDLDYLVAFYKQYGWLEVSIEGCEVAVDSAEGRADITITIGEGPRTYVTDVLVVGNEAFPNEVVLDRFDVHPGDPLNRVKNAKGAEAIARMYAEAGYLEAHVTPAVMVDKQAHEAFLDVTITENEQFRVGQIILSGFQDTQSFIVRRELKFRSGDILKYSLLAVTQRNLYETGLFRSVFVRQENSLLGDSAKKDVLVEVMEKKPFVFSSLAGYATIEKLRARAEFSNENLFGTGRGAGIAGWISSIDRGAEISYREPWTFALPWTTDVRLTGSFREEPGFHITRYGGRVTVSRRFFGRGNVAVSYRHENSEYSNINIPDFAQRRKPRIRSVSQSLTWDTRNDPFAPSRGYLGSLTNEYALRFLGSTNQFFKTRARFRYYREVTEGSVLATNIELGWVDAGGGLEDIPLNERLYAGGPTALRGFSYRSVGPTNAAGAPLGGRAKFVWNVIELRQLIWRWVGAVAFVDVGNVYERADRISLGSLRSSPGIGLRIDTPLGLLRADYGFNWFPEPGERAGAIHVSIGHAF